MNRRDMLKATAAAVATAVLPAPAEPPVPPKIDHWQIDDPSPSGLTCWCKIDTETWTYKLWRDGKVVATGTCKLSADPCSGRTTLRMSQATSV